MIGRIFKKIRKYIGKVRNPVAEPRNPTGLRGVAIGSAENPDFSPENIDQWEDIPDDEVTAFLYRGYILQVHSTNVQCFQYLRDKKQMIVQYLVKGRNPARAYIYSDVSEQDAIQVVQYDSKGIACWSIFRVRGKGNMGRNKKPCSPHPLII